MKPSPPPGDGAISVIAPAINAPPVASRVIEARLPEEPVNSAIATAQQMPSARPPSTSGSRHGAVAGRFRRVPSATSATMPTIAASQGARIVQPSASARNEATAAAAPSCTSSQKGRRTCMAAARDAASAA
jgi:hypothetical protein